MLHWQKKSLFVLSADCTGTVCVTWHSVGKVSQLPRAILQDSLRLVFLAELLSRSSPTAGSRLVEVPGSPGANSTFSGVWMLLSCPRLLYLSTPQESSEEQELKTNINWATVCAKDSESWQRENCYFNHWHQSASQRRVLFRKISPYATQGRMWEERVGQRKQKK